MKRHYSTALAGVLKKVSVMAAAEKKLMDAITFDLKVIMLPFLLRSANRVPLITGSK